MATMTTTRPVGLNRANEYAAQLTHVGTFLLRYGLAVVLLWVGLLKFTPYEQMAIMPLVAHSPFMAWMLGSFGLGTTAGIIGSYEIIAAVLIMLRPVSALLSTVGGMLAILTFLATVSFLVTTPAMAVYAPGHGFPLLGTIGQFLAKDIVLLGAAIYVTGEAWMALSTRKI